MTNPQKKMFKVLAMIPRTDKPGEDWFMKVGRAFENRDGSMNVYLDAIPCTSSVKLQIRELDARDLAEREARASNGGGAGFGRGDSAASRAATSFPADAASHGGSSNANEAVPF